MGIKMDFYEINELACQCRRDWNIDIFNPIDIFSLVINKIDNLTLVFIEMDDEISGACYKSNSQVIIFLNSIHNKLKQSFTLAHEIYHLKYGENVFNVCGKSDDEEEKIADLFASCLLIPNGALNSYKKEKDIKNWTIDEIVDCECFFKVSHAEFINRLKLIGENGEFKQSVEGVYGRDHTLYEPYTKNQGVIGNYVKLTKKLFEEELISKGLHDEFLTDAFCTDLVYGDLEDS